MQMSLWTAADARAHLRMPTASDDKYSRGVVGLRTGSRDYPGAAVLGVRAAARSGAGMIRYVGSATAEVLADRPEVVTQTGRVQCWVIGSGTDPSRRTAPEAAALRHILAGSVPVVVDAGALDLVSAASAPVIVTPHASEFRRLRAGAGLEEIDPDSEESVRRTARELGCIVLRKGARTIVATPAGWSAAVEAGTPRLATAGTGDVLAGLLGALVAPIGDAYDAERAGPIVATAAWVHGIAGRVVAGQLTLRAPGSGASDWTRAAAEAPTDPGAPIVAGDVADALPAVLGALAAVPEHGSGGAAS